MEKTQHTKLLIFTPETTARVEYAFEFIFRNILGVEVLFTANHDEFRQSMLAKINYSQTNLSTGLFLKSHPLLFEGSIANQKIETVAYRQMQLFFPTSEDSFLPFDPFACAFYLVSRYEEYLADTIDTHDRFIDSENILVRNGLHQKPLVDIMAYWVAEKISAQFPGFKIRERNFRFTTTIDIDNAWAFKNKSLPVTFGGILKAVFHGRWDELKQRMNVLPGFQKDPYDTYEYIFDIYKGHLNHILFFILIGNRDKYDKNISFRNKRFRQLIVRLSSVCEVGVHPSYASNSNSRLFDTEKRRLEEILGEPVTKSRQHFLKLKLPHTYQRLVKSGISDDYTMGFASLAGFRAGTCTPFHFFDLSTNQSTELIVHPFQVMDVTLKDYMKLEADDALQLIEKLMFEVKKVNGTFVSLWHNESLGDSGRWLGWKRVFEQVLETGLKYEHE